MSDRDFDQLVLFSTPTTAEVTDETVDAVAELFPELRVTVHHLDLHDLTNYSAILSGLRRLIPDIVEMEGELYVATASGTPQMHACRMLLASSGELPARLLHVRPRKFVTRTTPMVSEVDLTAPEFPTVQASRFAEFGIVAMATPAEALREQEQISRSSARRWAWWGTIPASSRH